MVKLERPHFVHCRGDARTRGRVHGETLRTVIADTVARWKDDLEKFLGLPFAAYQERLLRETRFREAVARWTPELLDEIAGIGEGAGLDADLAFSWQLMDEHWWYKTRLKDERTEIAEHCSSFAAAAGPHGPALVGQTLDIPVLKDGAQTVLLQEDPARGWAALVPTQAGMVASNGVNRAGLGVCVNSLSQLAYSATGLPVACVIRGVLARKSLEEASAFLAQIEHATGQNYVLASAHGIANRECALNEARATAGPAQGHHSRYVLHTNHPFANKAFAPGYKNWKPASPAAARKPDDGFTGSSEERFAYLEKVFAEKDASWNADRAMAMFRQPPVCRIPGAERGGFTAMAVVIELSDPPRLHATSGPPVQRAYQAYSFKEQPE